jgi:hypothetical protein
MNTLIVALAGGLGNQLFQYAFGRRLTLVNNAEMYLDASGYATQKWEDAETGFRTCELPNFEIAGRFLESETGRANSGLRIRRRTRKLWYFFLSIADSWRPYYLRRNVVEPADMYFKFDERVYNRAVKGRVTIRGFWQSQRYFRDIADVLRRELLVKNEMDVPNAQLAAIMSTTNSVGVHVRHGDNAGTMAASLGVLPGEYYDLAIRRLSRDVSHLHLYVFSDDIPWARQVLKPEQPTTFVDHNGPARSHEDLRLMTFCKHHIMGNSTFSWWGAWLGKKDGQIVYAPRRYYQNIDRPNPDLYPESWRLI